MSASTTEIALVFSYWFRVVIGDYISVRDLATIICDFTYETEQFNQAISGMMINVSDNGKYISNKKRMGRGGNGYGDCIATPDRAYHWKLKVIKRKDAELYIGLIEANKCEEYKSTDLNTSAQGYSYLFSAAARRSVLDNRKGIAYGRVYQSDVIDIFLDLREGSMYKDIVFFKKNMHISKVTRVMKVKSMTAYRLVIGMWNNSKKVKLISFGIEY